VSSFSLSLSLFSGALWFLIGSFASGILGDKLSRSSHPTIRNYGRIILGQIGLLVGLPFIYSFFILVGIDGSFLLFLVTGGGVAFFIAFSEQGVDPPLITEVVHPNSRATLLAINSFFVIIISSFGSLMVGWLASSYGYIDPSSVNSTDIWNETELNFQEDTNFYALGKAMMIVGIFFWGLQIPVYFSLYFLYPSQREAIHEQLRREKEGGGGSVELSTMEATHYDEEKSD